MTAAAIRFALYAVMMLLLAVDGHAAEPACPGGSRVSLDLPVTRAALAHDRPITIVALGSSSTEGAGASAPDRTYPARLAALLQASWPDDRVIMLNRGIGGQTVTSVVPRIEADVIAAHPTLVIWQVGTNEVLHGMDPGAFEALLDKGLRLLSTIGSDVVLMDYQLAPKMPAEAVTSVYGDIIAREARAHGMPLFSRAALMRKWEAADPSAGSEMIGADGLHHPDRGYACVAGALDLAIVAGAAPKVAAVSVKVK